MVARFGSGLAGFALAVFFCLCVGVGALIVLFVRRLFGVGSRVSGKALPLLWHQALHLARHELPKVNAQTGARRRARPSRHALKRGDAGARWHGGCRWHL